MPKADDRPRREQIAADLRALILDGKYADKLPGTAILAAWFKTTNNTIQHAVEILKAEGLVRGEKGVGTTVTVPNRTLVLADPDPQLEKYRYEILDVATLPVSLPAGSFALTQERRKNNPDPETVPADVARLLGLEADEVAVRRLRVMRVRETGEPVELSWSYYPVDLVEGTAAMRKVPITDGVKRILAERGYPQVGFEDRVSTRPPTKQELEVLDLPEYVSVLRTLRIVWSHDRKPVEATVMVKGGHLYELLYSGSTH
jgi:GntR family transcriptional regulator